MAGTSYDLPRNRLTIPPSPGSRDGYEDSLLAERGLRPTTAVTFLAIVRFNPRQRFGERPVDFGRLPSGARIASCCTKPGVSVGPDGSWSSRPCAASCPAFTKARSPRRASRAGSFRLRNGTCPIFRIAHRPSTTMPCLTAAAATAAPDGGVTQQGPTQRCATACSWRASANST